MMRKADPMRSSLNLLLPGQVTLKFAHAWTSDSQGRSCLDKWLKFAYAWTSDSSSLVPGQVTLKFAHSWTSDTLDLPESSDLEHKLDSELIVM
jgi:hypothetical protein